MNYLVVDIGSSNGKIYLARLSETKEFQMEEIDRFDTERSFWEGHITTDIFSIYERICKNLKRLSRKRIRIDGMGIDSWCSDFCVLDLDSGTISNPVFYRDKRTDGYEELISEIMDYRELYELTSQRRIPDSTLCQMISYKKEYPFGLEGNKRILFIGDTLMYLFTGKICSEASVASYSQMFNMKKGVWENKIFRRFGIPVNIQPPVVNAGTILGKIRKDLEEYLGIDSISVVTPAIHDTSSAVVAIPAKKEEKWAFLATGSWFLMGMEAEGSVNMEKAFQYQLSNTGLAFDKTLLKKNIMGMWLLQECKRQWEIMGLSYTWAEIAELAESAKAFSGMIDADNYRFYHPDDMLEEIVTYLKETGQKIPDKKDVGAVARIIYESIVFKVAAAVEMLKDTTGEKIDVLYVIGGANRVRLLNQFLADILDMKVITGPSEASAAGNAMLQAYGLKEVSSGEEIREIIRSSVKMEEYYPEKNPEWKKQQEKYQLLCCK